MCEGVYPDARTLFCSERYLCMGCCSQRGQVFGGLDLDQLDTYALIMAILVYETTQVDGEHDAIISGLHAVYMDALMRQQQRSHQSAFQQHCFSASTFDRPRRTVDPDGEVNIDIDRVASSTQPTSECGRAPCHRCYAEADTATDDSWRRWQ